MSGRGSNSHLGGTGDSTVVGWLPLYDDMGLIGNILQPLYVGASAILMPPMAFLEKPARWLKAISDHGAETSGSPDFAYELCVRKVTAEEKRGLDLSRWRLAFSGAEPIRADTLRRFAEAFAGCGFQKAGAFSLAMDWRKPPCWYGRSRHRAAPVGSGRRGAGGPARGRARRTC